MKNYCLFVIIFFFSSAFIDVYALKPFPDRPFKAYSDDQMMKLKESIQNVGLLSPVIVCHSDISSDFIIIEDHNRVEAFKQLELHKIPVSIKDIDFSYLRKAEQANIKHIINE